MSYRLIELFRVSRLIAVILLGCAMLPAVATTGDCNLDGGWGSTMHSDVSDRTHVRALMLKWDGSRISGAFSAFDKSNPNLDGSYDLVTGTLSLSRDTVWRQSKLSF